MSRKRVRRWMQRDSMAAFLFLAPSFIGFSLFFLLPFAVGVIYSFYDQVVDGSFVGLVNYAELLNSSSFRMAVKNTLLFTGVSVPILIMTALTLALVFQKQLWFKHVMKSAIVMPLVVPVASIIMITQIFIDWNGVFNAWLYRFDYPRVDWLNSDLSLVVIIGIYLWKNIGYFMILFLAGLQTIPKSYYETAYLEGAGPCQRFFSITIVYLTPTMVFAILLSLVNSFKVFREAFLLAGAYPYNRMYMMQHYMNNMFYSLNIQKLTAAAVLMVGFMVLIVFLLMGVERKFRRILE